MTEFDPELFKFGENKRGITIVEIALQMGGKVFDLPSHYQAMIAEAITTVHSCRLNAGIQKLLVSGKFRGSMHPRLAGMTLAMLLKRDFEENKKYHQKKKTYQK